MIYLVLLPFIIQAIAIFFDEIYFHHKRGLPKWERIGHPLDTLSVLICFLYALMFPCTKSHLITFYILSFASCLFITKDEFVHSDICPKTEMWLHALLFINHPIMLFSLSLMWSCIHQGPLSTLIDFSQNNISFLKTFIISQSLFITLFGLYQTFYWNFIWKERQA
jgi:hypothetical protein